MDDRGQDLVIAPDYIGRGVRERAAEIVNLDLGPKTDREIMAAAAREIEQERFTGIDRRLQREADLDGRVSAHHRDPLEQARRAGRLATLARLGLATCEGQGVYRLDPDLEPSLRAMGKRGDIIATMNAALGREGRGGLPQDQAIFDPAEGKALVGAILARGLADELADRRYLIVAATDGRTHFVDIGGRAELDGAASVVRIAPTVAEVRAADRTIAEVAAASGGRYSIDAHLAHDPGATERFAEAHVRRLEAMRRGGAGVDRGSDGSWAIASDHVDRALAFERRLAAAQPVALEILAVQPVAALARHDGLTWLDEQCVAGAAEPTGGGFGTDVRNALAVRRQWLLAQELASEEGDRILYRADMTNVLRQRELRRVAGQMSQALGLDYVPHQGGRIEGIVREPVQVGTGRYAVVEDGKSFTLVPWRPVLEKQIGRQVSGVDRGGSISWSFGRGRGGPEVE